MLTHFDASSEHVLAVGYSFDSWVPLDSSYFAVAVSAYDEHLDNEVVACIDWDHYAGHDVDVGLYDSSFHFDILAKKNVLINYYSR